MSKRLIPGLLVVFLSAGCASNGGTAPAQDDYAGDRWSDSKCWNTRTLAEREKGNPDRQEQARRDYKNHCR